MANLNVVRGDFSGFVGWATKDIFSNIIDIRTVSSTETAAKTNWLVLNGYPVYQSHSEERIYQMFDALAKDQLLVEVNITERRKPSRR